MTLPIPGSRRLRSPRAPSSLRPLFAGLLALGLALPALAGAAESNAPIPSFSVPVAGGARPDAARPGGTLVPTTTPHAVGFIPVGGNISEDVDLVEVSIPLGPFPNTAVWPTEGIVHFIDEIGEFEYASLPTLSPNISGVDFVSNGTVGAFATLGWLYTYDMNAPSILATVPLPGTPARRDIDPMLIFGGTQVVYPTGTEIHCIDVATGLILWTVPLPTPVVEAVDPVMNATETRLFVPSEGNITVIDPASGAVLAITPLAGPLVREVDGLFNAAQNYFYIPVSTSLQVLDGVTGTLVGSYPLAAPLIEGNDIEVDPTGAYGYLPTLATMNVIDMSPTAAGTFYFFIFPPGTQHQRNHDTVFTPLGVLPARALYATQGLVWIFDVGGGLVSTQPTPGTLIDGVDPAFTDAPPAGTRALLSTLGFTHVIDVIGLTATMMVTPGVLRTDVDPKPGPMPGNKILQPVLGGIVRVTLFDPAEWVVTTSTGLYCVDVAGPFVTEYIPFPSGMAYRGGDAQPTTLLGPAEPAWSVDNPDQDFLTKCWEYKYAVNRWPYPWWNSDFNYYPHWVPYGPFGPPAYSGWDLLNRIHVNLRTGFSGHKFYIDDGRNLTTTWWNIPPPLGGLIWDWDNKRVKVPLYGQQEMIVDLSTYPHGYVNYSYVPYGGYRRWYPVVDRINGWEVTVLRGGRVVRVWDHVRNVLIASYTLPARCIRRPVIDEQRKIACFTLADRRLAFWNLADLYANPLTLPYYTPYLPGHVMGTPVFDLYNHMALVKVRGPYLYAFNIDNAAIVWNSGLLPYHLTGPIQIDCYNKVAKCYARDLIGGHWEMWLDMYPMVVAGGVPNLAWLALPSAPYGYPLFDSKDGYQFQQFLPNLIRWSPVFNPYITSALNTPFPMAGMLFIDRVNKYALVRLTNRRLFLINQYRLTSGLPGATATITLPVDTQDDVVFDTQGHFAAVHMNDGRVAIIDMLSLSLTSIVGGGPVPALSRQLYVDPFSQMVSYPYHDTGAGQGGMVLIDLTPLRASPPNSPITTIMPSGTDLPMESEDVTPPPALPAPSIVQMPAQPGDLAGVAHFEVLPGSGEPGTVLRAVNQTAFNTDLMDDPNEDVIEEDGAGETSVIAANGDAICFTLFDAAGNASGQTCVTATIVGVPPGAPRLEFAFRNAGGHPVRGEALLSYALPSRSAVKLEIFDVGGRLVETVVDGDAEAGVHEASWDLTAGGRPVASGVYFAKIRTGENEARIRLVVLN